MKKLLLALSLAITLQANAQSLYFPPVTGSGWDTLSPSTLGWCQDRIDSLTTYLGARNTLGFIILKDGKIALERYYGTFTQTSTNKWASAGKSLMATLTGIAQEKGFLNIMDPATNYLGQGWTSCTSVQELQITIRDLITMTSGLNDDPTGLLCNNNSVNANCLQYFAPPGTRWAYHTGAYRKCIDLLESATSLDRDTYTSSFIGQHIGMSGTWNNYVFHSSVRDAARFGLLTLNRGVWDTDTILHDTGYFNDMTNTSQNLNESYGYLWWLNGKASFMLPGSQTIYPTSLLSNAAPDMIAALGADDQKIYVVPSQNLVVVRLGNSAYSTSAALSPFDNELWGYINNLPCVTTGISYVINSPEISIFPNPTTGFLRIQNKSGIIESVSVSNALGQLVLDQKTDSASSELNLNLPAGIYMAEIITDRGKVFQKIVIE